MSKYLTIFSATMVIAALVTGTGRAEDTLIARMAVEHAGDHPSPSPATGVDPANEISASSLTYAYLGEDRDSIDGYLARPKGDGPFPGIIVIHEWWGLNDNIKWMADRLAGEGYLALAVDLYEGDVATDREGAMALIGKSRERPERLIENLRQARKKLAELGATRVGTIGWCFGGGWSLRAALDQGKEVDAAVIYYGRLTTEASELQPLEAPVLGIFGELDTGIPVDQVRAFEAALESLGKPASIHIYPDANHAFANPSGTRYNEEAATDAWAKTLAFFREHLDG